MYNATEASSARFSKDPSRECVEGRLAWAESIVKQYELIKKGVVWTPTGWNGWSLHAQHAQRDRPSVVLRAVFEDGLGARQKFILFFRIRPRRIRAYCAVFLRGLRRLDNLTPRLRELAELPDPNVPTWVIENIETFLANTAVGSYDHALSTIAELGEISSLAKVA